MNTFPSEITVIHDPETGRAVRRLTSFKGNSHHFYFTNPGWWDDGRRLLFSSDRMGRTNLFSVELESGEITQHTDKDMPRPPAETPFLFAAANPGRAEVYFWRGDDLMAVDLIKNRERKVWTIRPGYWGNILNVTADGAHICAVIYEDLSAKFPVDLLGGYVGFEEYHAAHPHSMVLRISVETGAVDVLWEEKYWIGHVNTSPTRTPLVSFCHEGPWEKVDNRIWMLDASTGKVWPLREPTAPDEKVGHEYWMADGETIGYHGNTPEGTKFFGNVHFDNTGAVDYPTEGETGHVHSLDASLIVGDGGQHVRVWGKDGASYGQSRLLCQHKSSSKVQQVHVHPRFSADRRTVVFTSDRSGYGQVYEVEVGDWQDLPMAK